MTHQQEDQNHGQMGTGPSVTPAETDNGTPADKLEKKKLSSSSSISSEDLDEDDFFQIEGPILGTTLSFADNAAISDIKKQSSSSSHSSSHAPTDPKQSPPVQNMSRAPDGFPDPKRIPSSVFARSKSKSPTDWSVTSNEGLFSISLGNASFSKDHFFLYGKTGDMSNLNDPLAPLPPLPRLSTSSSPMSTEVATVQASARVKPDVIDNTDSKNSMSHRSDASTTSFVFPILAGDVRSSESLKDEPPEPARQSTSQLSQSQQGEPLVVQQAPKVEDKALEAEQAPALAPASAQTPAPAPASAPPESTPQPPATTKWFPCCSCCSC